MNKNSHNGRVVVAMSGGVDSSVAALVLKQAGYDVVGITMRLFPYDEENGTTKYNKGCCTPQDVEDARDVCRAIGIPHYLMNFEREFEAHVIDYFCEEYARGRTPHPCLACNDKIKFNFLLKKSLALGAMYVATGHYARLKYTDNRWHLLKGIDQSKDQSYVLHTLSQDQLAHILFPIGWYEKSQIRELAHSAGLTVANKEDSQDICFIPNGDYSSFIAKRIAPQPGEIVNSSGDVIGHHNGIEKFTVGQRKGLGIATGKPLYVLGVNVQERRVIIGEAAELLQDSLWASQVNYTVEHPDQSLKVKVKIRYKASEVPATIYPKGNNAIIKFDEPQRAITPGQAVAFYKGEELLGGGIIEGALAFNKPDFYKEDPLLIEI